MALAERECAYDTETTGANARQDQVLQIAAIITDDDFNELEWIDERSRLLPSVIPAPMALKVTHVDPYEIARAPHSPYEFARMVHALFKRLADAGVVAFSGFNTLNYDEEILRSMFWLNHLDPYVTSGRHLRVDYLNFARALHARNPEAMVFPVNPETGKKVFKLEKLAPANGFQDHNAHDALGDCRATLHVARVIRDTDLALFQHMKRLSNARASKEFMEDEVVFQVVGGAMLNPGAYTACLITSDRENDKAKIGWNLAFDPTPFLDASAEDILAAMRKSGTPFRSLKANKMSQLFPMNWEFLNRAVPEGQEDPDPATIDERVRLIRDNAGFQARVRDAIALKKQGYDDPEILEDKIYSAGFPDHKDKGLQAKFHDAPSWAERFEIARDFQKSELKSISIRMVYNEEPSALPEAIREKCDAALAKDPFTLSRDSERMTVGKFMDEVHAMLEKDPEDAEARNILNWCLETYPIASEWAPLPAKEDDPSEDGSQTSKDAPVDDQGDPAESDQNPDGHEADGVPHGAIKVSENGTIPLTHQPLHLVF